MSHMKLSGYVGHLSLFCRMFTIACCLVVGLWLGLDLVSGCAHVFVLISIVIVTLLCIEATIDW